MIRYLFLTCLFFVLSAQTPVAVTGPGSWQLRGVPGGTVVWVTLPNGSVAMADIGPGLTLDTTGARPTLRATTPPTAIPTFVSGEVLTAGGAGNRVFVLSATPIPGSVRIFQNGLRQTEGVDYTLSGVIVQFIPYYGDMAASKAVVVADYSK